jgi:VWFA-related protein
VKVSDSRGNNLTRLSQGDFLVFDENEPRQITHFNRDTEPLDLVLLLDVSNSMTPSLTAMAARTREALAQLHPSDRVALMLFSTRSEVSQPFTTDFRQIQRRILDSIYKQSLGSSGTLMNEALLTAANYLNSEPRTSRRAILIVTDNQSARQTTTDDQASRALSDTDATLNAMLVGNAPHPQRTGRYTNPSSAPPDVFQLTNRTGGEVIDGDNPGDAFRKIIEKILTRFTLDYAAPPAEPGSYRRIRIELTPDAKRRYPDAKIEARAGYYARK